MGYTDLVADDVTVNEGRESRVAANAAPGTEQPALEVAEADNLYIFPRRSSLLNHRQRH